MEYFFSHKSENSGDSFSAVQNADVPSRYPSYGTSYGAPTTLAAAPVSTTPVP